MAVPIGYVGAGENNITTANSATTNTTNLNALISSLSGAGGGTIWFNEAGTYPINGTITWLPRVSFKMASGSRFVWSGSNSIDIFTTQITDVPVNLDMECYVDEGTSHTGVIFRLHSCQNCHFKLRAYGSNTSSIFLYIEASSTAGQPPGGGRNFAFNTIDAQHSGQTGIGLYITGIPSGFGGQAQVATLNTFYNIQCTACAQYGIRIDAWADNNTFSGNTYVGMNGAGSVGLHINAATPTTFTAVYATHFTQLAIDTFGTGLGRYGVVLNNSQAMYCEAFFQDPPAENGSFTGANCTSYWWKSFQSGGSIYIHEKAVTTGL